jgi:hypothetical protein
MTIEDRLNRLESSVRRWKTMCVAMALACCGLFLLGGQTTQPAHIEAKAITTEALVVRTADDSGPAIRMRAEEGFARLEVISNSGNEAAVEIYVAGGLKGNQPPTAMLAVGASEKVGVRHTATLVADDKNGSINVRKLENLKSTNLFTAPAQPKP